MKKKAKFNIMCIGGIFFIVSMIIYRFWGIIGDKVLIGITIQNIGMLILAVSIAIYTFKEVKFFKEQILKIAILGTITLLLVVFSIHGEIVVVKDYFQGAQNITLYKCYVENVTGTKGILQSHYYLNGIDTEGKRHRVEINASAYEQLKDEASVNIKYYKTVNRIVEYN